MQVREASIFTEGTVKVVTVVVVVVRMVKEVVTVVNVMIILMVTKEDCARDGDSDGESDVVLWMIMCVRGRVEGWRKG